MTERIHQYGPDELYLSGRLQVDAAIDVLTLTEINLSAVEMLTLIRELHELSTIPEAKNDLQIYLRGTEAAAMKADITTSALLAEQNQNLSTEAHIAARGLLDVLRQEI